MKVNFMTKLNTNFMRIKVGFKKSFTETVLKNLSEDLQSKIDIDFILETRMKLYEGKGWKENMLYDMEFFEIYFQILGLEPRRALELGNEYQNLVKKSNTELNPIDFIINYVYEIMCYDDSINIDRKDKYNLDATELKEQTSLNFRKI